jgi:ElaB/YqjD/DUF883 family membrane-anchored ribosome-binding protein
MADVKQQAHTGASNAADAAKRGLDAAEKGVHGLVDKAGDLAKQGKEAVSNVMDQAGEMGHKVQRWAGDAYEVTADKVKESVDGTTDLIRKYPIPAVLVGLGVGIIIGKLMR